MRYFYLMRQVKNSWLFVGILFLLSCQQQMESKLGVGSKKGEHVKLMGDYLGQTLPDSLPVLFAPGIVSNGMDNRDIAFTPDGNELYFSSSLGKYTTILKADRKQGIWTKPEVAAFASNPKYQYIEPCISSNGKQLFFASDQPTSNISEKVDFNIWVMNRKNEKWSIPELLPDIISSKTEGEFFPSVSDNGNMYFTRSALAGQSFIYRSELKTGIYQPAIRLPKQVNCGSNRFNAFISPSEEYIIVPALGMKDSFGRVDYYISFRSSNDQWSKPMNMGSLINSPDNMGWSVSLSPDGSLLFFMSKRGLPEESQPIILSADFLTEMQAKPQNGNSDIYWMKAGFIDGLKQKAVWE